MFLIAMQLKINFKTFQKILKIFKIKDVLLIFAKIIVLTNLYGPSCPPPHQFKPGYGPDNHQITYYEYMIGAWSVYE